MPATAVMAGVAASNAAIAAEEAASAHRAACQVMMKGYQDTPSVTTEARREYAQCVTDVYGSGTPMPAAVVVIIKVWIVASLIAALVGAYHEYEDGYGFGDAVIGFFMWGMMAALGLATIGIALLALFS